MTANIMVVKDGTVTFGPVGTPTAIECQVSSAIISATPDPKEFRGMCGISNVPGITAYVFNVEGAQDWSAGGVSTYLYENDGTLVEFTFVPTSTADPSATGQCWIAPGDFGGAAGEIATFSVSLGVEGKPAVTSAAAQAAAASRPLVDA